MITLAWDSLNSASAYNVYADYGQGFSVANPIPITTRTKYTFFWVNEDGKNQKVVKGNNVALWVSALRGDQCTTSVSDCIQIAASDTIATDYFAGFANVLTADHCVRILSGFQGVEKVFPDAQSVSRSRFVKLFPKLASHVSNLYKASVDPRDEGACVPFSTIVAKYFTAKGIPCYRGQGVFISQFHSFNLVVVDSIEYILDFTADQFLPSVAPVFIPRDYCYVDARGKPTRTPDDTTTPMYVIERIMEADQINFTDTDAARKYKHFLDSLLSR